MENISSESAQRPRYFVFGLSRPKKSLSCRWDDMSFRDEATADEQRMARKKIYIFQTEPLSPNPRPRIES